MPIEISESNKNHGNGHVNKNATQQSTKNESHINKQAIAVDKIELTPEAKKLHDIQKNLSHSADIDNAKIAEIKQAISEGNYKIDAEKLANNIADFEFSIDTKKE